MLVIMRSFLFLATIAPLVIACDNPDTDACASAFTVSSADVATFCATYTTALETQTTDLPAYATYCSMKPKKLSSACSCLVAQTTLQTVTAVATSGVGVLSGFGRRLFADMDSCRRMTPVTAMSSPALPRRASLLIPVSYTHLRAHETRHDLVCRLLLEKKK